MPHVISAHRSGLHRHECPREERDHIDELCRPRVIGPHTRDDRDREVAGRMPMEVTDRVQADCDRVVDLGRCAADRIHLPELIAPGDGLPLALEGRLIPRVPTTIAVSPVPLA